MDEVKIRIQFSAKQILVILFVGWCIVVHWQQEIFNTDLDYDRAST